jgi:hypothetical protein
MRLDFFPLLDILSRILTRIERDLGYGRFVEGKLFSLESAQRLE